MADPFYMKNIQTKGFNEVVRASIINWVFRHAQRFKLLPETIYITINLMDRYLSLNDTSPD